MTFILRSYIVLLVAEGTTPKHSNRCSKDRRIKMELNLQEQAVINFALRNLKDAIGEITVTDEFIEGLILKIWSK